MMSNDDVFSEVVESINIEDEYNNAPGFYSWLVTLVIYEPQLRRKTSRMFAPVENYERRRNYLFRTFQRMPFIRKMSDMYLIIRKIDDLRNWNRYWVKDFKEIDKGNCLSGPCWFISLDIDLRTFNECKKLLSEIRIPVGDRAWIEFFKVFDNIGLKRYMNRLNECRLVNNRVQFIDETDKHLQELIDFTHGIYNEDE